MADEHSYVTYLSDEPVPEAHEDGAARGIRSIEIGFRLLQCLEKAAGPLSLKALSEAAGVSASRARFYLVSFMRLGLIEQDHHYGRYALGPYARHLGLVALQRMDVTQAAEQPLQRLCDTLEAGVYLSVWGNRGPTIVYTLDGASEVPMSVRVGYVLPLLHSATGRVFLSHLPRHATDALVQDELVRALRERGTAAADELSGAIDEIIESCRRDGCAGTEGLLNTGFAAVAAPVFEYRGRIAATVTTIGLGGRIDSHPEGPTVRELRATAAEVSAALGYEDAAAPR